MTTPLTVAETAFCRRVSKPWGYELITTAPDLPYTGKLLSILAGSRLSLQSHDEKVETLTLVTGHARLELEDGAGRMNEFLMEPGVGYTVPLGRRHRIRAIAESLVMEASTPERGVTRRYDDDYGRDDETPADRANS